MVTTSNLFFQINFFLVRHPIVI